MDNIVPPFPFFSIQYVTKSINYGKSKTSNLKQFVLKIKTKTKARVVESSGQGIRISCVEGSSDNRNTLRF